jgi:excisionase family DNA binding protein
MTLIKLTPQQAADKARVSRGTIMNAIKDKSLFATRDNQNHWKIDTDNLAEWVANRSVTDSDNTDITVSRPSTSVDGNAMRIAVLEVEIKAKDQRIADLEQERDTRLSDKDQQIANIRKDRDDQIAMIKEDRDRWVDHVKTAERSAKRRWWPF